MIRLLLFALFVSTAQCGLKIQGGGSGEIGEYCQSGDGWEGACRLSYECASLGRLVPQGFSPQLCNISGPVICCPDDLLRPLPNLQSVGYETSEKGEDDSDRKLILKKPRPKRRRPDVHYMKPHAHLYVKTYRPSEDGSMERVRIRRPTYRRKPGRLPPPPGRRKRRPGMKKGHRGPTTEHSNHNYNTPFGLSSVSPYKMYSQMFETSTPTYYPVFKNEVKDAERPQMIERPQFVDNEMDTVYSEMSEAYSDSTVFGSLFTTTRPTRSNTKRVSDLKCEDYGGIATETIAELSKFGVVPVRVEKCSLSSFIHSNSGSVSSIAEFPHLAAISYEDDKGKTFWGCGGSLISENYILTAAHCTHAPLGRPGKVRLGEVKLDMESAYKPIAKGSQAQEIRVSEVILHPLYNRSIRQNDLALLKLAKKVRFSDSIRPACLQTSPIKTRSFMASEWGQIQSLSVEIKLSSNKSHPFTDIPDHIHLQKIAMTSLENRDCSIPYDVGDSFICASSTSAKQLCNGEGGGPLQIRNPGNKCMYSIIGIATGRACQDTLPSVFTRITHFLPWIESIAWP